MSCKLIYDKIKFDSEEQILEYIQTGKYPNLLEALRNKSFFEAIDYVETQLTSEFDKRLIKALRNSAKLSTSHRFGIQVRSAPPANTPSAIAMANPTMLDGVLGVDLVFYESREKEIDTTIFLHELVHSVTMAQLTFNPKSRASRKLEALRMDVYYYLLGKEESGVITEKERHLLRKTNALENVHEILAWGLTNRDFQEVLKSTQYSVDKSLWNTFVEFLLDLLGLPKSDGSALSELIGVSNKLLMYDSQVFSPNVQLKPANVEYVSEDLKKESEKLNRDDATSIYTDSSTKAEYEAVTSKVIPKFQEKEFDPNYNAGQVDADRIWKNTPKDIEQKTWISGDKAITYDQHLLAVNENRARFIARADLYHLVFHQYFTKDSSISNQMGRIMAEYGITDSEIDWLTTPIDNKLPLVSIIQNRTGTDFWDQNGKDKIVTELAIKSDILGWAGRVDLSIDHGDNILSFYDIKTGYGINKEFQNYLIKYGDTYRVVWDNALNRAKLQLMLYAVIAKSERPDLKFRNLKVLHIPSEQDKHIDSIHNNVDVPAFLQIVKNFLEATQGTKYKQLLEKSPDIFNAEHYNAVTYSSIGEKLSQDGDPAMELKLRILELQALIMRDKELVGKVIEGKKSASERAKRIEELMKQIIELKGDKSISYAAWDTDMSWMDNWLGSSSYSTNPYVQIYYKILTEQKQKARNDYESWRIKFNNLLERGLKELGATSVTNYFGGPNRKALFDKLLVTEVHGETSDVKIVTPSSSKWSTLTPTQQELALFIDNSVQQFLDDSKSNYTDPRTGKKIALANQVITYVKKKGVEVPVTNMGLRNKGMRKSGQRDEKKFTSGFYPKFAPQLDDVAEQHGGYLNKGMLKYLWNKNTTNFYEVVYDQWTNTTEAIPMKGLGGPMIDYTKNFTLNVELAIDSFVKQHYYKQHLDQVYTYGLAMKLYLGIKPEGSTKYKRTIDWFEDTVNLHILGRKDITDDWVSRKLKRPTLQGWEQFNFTKFLRSLKSFFTGPTMWLKPVTGISNAIFASLVTLKEAIKNSAFISGPHSNFGITDLAAGFTAGIGMQFDAAQGKLRSNKAYLLMEKFGYLPDNYDWYTRPNELLTTRNKFFTSKTMMAFHGVPEEVIATAMFVAQMKSMGVWDHYKPVTKQLSDGSTYLQYEWDGTVRGKINTSNIDGEPRYEDVTELLPEEINAIKFLYEKIHGGYRLDERVRAEYYVMGELLMQFKKYMPGVMKNVFASRGIRNTQGFLQETILEDGTKILKWTPQVVEGRWRLLWGLMANYMRLKNQVNPQGELGSKTMESLKLQPNTSYDWSKLSEAQKEDVIDIVLTFSMWMLLLVGYNLAWDRDEEDSLKKLYARIMNDANLQVNPMELMNNAINFGRPVTINKFAKLMNSGVETLWSATLLPFDEDAATTEQGNLRGMKEFQRNLHFLSSYHDVVKTLNESPDLQEALDYRLK